MFPALSICWSQKQVQTPHPNTETLSCISPPRVIAVQQWFFFEEIQKKKARWFCPPEVEIVGEVM